MAINIKVFYPEVGNRVSETDLNILKKFENAIDSAALSNARAHSFLWRLDSAVSTSNYFQLFARVAEGGEKFIAEFDIKYLAKTAPDDFKSDLIENLNPARKD